MDRFEHLSHFAIVTAVLIGVISTARTARLLIHDQFPPVLWLREKILVKIGPDNPWAMLVSCQFCLMPYLMAGMFGWAWLSGINTAWWIINGIWAGSYLGAILVSYDEPE